MIVDVEWISRNYDYFNDLLWSGELPRCAFKTNMSSRTWGLATARTNPFTMKMYDFSITISNYYDSPEEVKQSTLIHEMIHIADYYFHPEHYIGRRRRYDAHGPEFFLKEARRIAPYGYDIQKNVTAEEQAVSQLSGAVKKRVGAKATKGTPIGLYRRGNDGKWFYVKYKTVNDLRTLMPHWNYGIYVICISHSEDVALKKSAYSRARLAGTANDSMCDVFVKLKVSQIVEYGKSAMPEVTEAELEKAKRIMNGESEEPTPEPTPEPQPEVQPEPEPTPEPEPEVNEPIPPVENDTPEVDTVDDVPDAPQDDMSRVYDKIENMLTALLLDINHGPKYTLHIDDDDPVRSFKPDLEIERSYLHGPGGGLYFGGFDVTPCSSLSQLRDMLAFGESDKAAKMMYDKLAAYGLLKKKTDEMFFRGTLVERMAMQPDMVDTNEGPLDHVDGLTYAAQKKINDYEWIVAIE